MAKKNTPPLNKAQKIKVKEIVAKNALRNGTLANAVILIERELGITLSISQLSRYLAQAEQEWLTSSQQNIGKIKAKEVAKLDHLEIETIEQWERSKLDAQIITESETADGTFETTKTSGQCGDPRYMHNLLEIAQRRAKLLGLDAPAKTELTGKDGNPLEINTTDLARSILEERKSNKP